MNPTNEKTWSDAESLGASDDVMALLLDQKADTTKRIVAFVIDVVIASILWQVPLVGKVLGLGYILFRDGLDFEFMKGRSMGKKLMGLKPVRSKERPMDLSASVRRNWVFLIGGVAGLLSGVPLIGWLIVLVSVCLGALVSLYEIYLVLTEPEGRRWGDVFAGTRVVQSAE